jgi:phosphoribosylglycinamide formyltransferase 1
MVSVIFLISGGGGNMRFVKLASDVLDLNIEIPIVIADRSIIAEGFLKEKKIPFKQIHYDTESPDEMNEILERVKPSIVVTNIHKILAPSTLATHHNFINLHYSILPAFKGLVDMKPIHAARRLNSAFIGVTTHEVTEKVDSGRIIQQGIFRVDWSAAEHEIEDTVFKLGAVTLLNTLLDTNQNSRPTTDYLKINNFEVSLSSKINFDLNYLETLHIWQNTKNDSFQQTVSIRK